MTDTVNWDAIQAMQRAGWTNDNSSGTIRRPDGSVYFQRRSGDDRDRRNAEQTQRRDMRSVLDAQLEQWGLKSLSKWAWKQIQLDRDPASILIDMRQQKAYKQRFKGMELREQKGLAPIDEGTYLGWEKQTQELFHRAGVPKGFYDSPDDFAGYIGNGVTVEALGARLQQGWRRVAEAPIEVRDAFRNYYGRAGDNALLTFFLDPDRAEPFLEQATEASLIGGIGMAQQISLTRQRAEDLYQRGVREDEARRGFAEISELDSVFDETFSEDNDLTAETEGVDAAFQLGGGGAKKIEQRIEARVAAGRGGGGAIVRQGGTGFGTAE